MRRETDKVLECFEEQVSLRMGVPFQFPRYTSAWKREKRMAKKLIEYAGGWYQACEAIRIMFNHEGLRWKTRTSLDTCLKDIHFALAIMAKRAEEARKAQERAHTPLEEDL